jgi:glycerate kinase
LHLVGGCGLEDTPADAAEGPSAELMNFASGSLHSTRVTGPTGIETVAYFAIFSGPGPKSAVVEAAPATIPQSLLTRVPDPSERTSYGLGELIKTALSEGAERVVVVCGEPLTVDGGAGMAQALGIGLLDNRGRQIRWGGRALAHLVRIDLSGVDPVLRRVEIHCTDDRNFILCGPRGIAKLASRSDPLLSAAFENYADVIQHQLGVDVRTVAGGGAGGGVGASLYAFFNATLESSSSISALRSA